MSKILGSHLIPTPRVDKNGRVVVRHMKSDDAVSGAKDQRQHLPVPVVKGTGSTALARLEAAAVLMKLTDLNHSQHNKEYQNMVAGMESFSFETIQKIMQLEGESGRMIAYGVMLDIRNPKQSDEIFVRDVIALTEHLNMSNAATDAYIRALRYYDAICPLDDDESYPQERFDQAMALITATSAMENLAYEKRIDYSALTYVECLGQKYDVPLIADRGVSDFIINASESERDQAVAIITERGIADFESMAALLDQGTPNAISGGAL